MTNAPNGPIKTPFYQFHVDAGARIVEFAGFLMPVQYEGITAEHQAVRNNVGLFDLSHMGEFEVAGSDAVAFLEKHTTNNVAALETGKVQYSCMTYPEGGIVDDLLIYLTGDAGYLLVVNASNVAKDFEWLNEHLSGDVTLVDRSREIGLLAIQGPNAQPVMAELTDFDLESMPYYSHATAEVAGVELLFSRTGYTGEDGFEIYIPEKDCSGIWQAVVAAGAKLGMRLIGLGARDTLRLEMKMALYGNDIDRTTTPIEAGLGWIVDLEKEFLGRDVIARQKDEKPPRRLVCLQLEGRAVPRQGFDVFDGDQQIGRVTSGTFSPSLQKPVALGYLKRSHTRIGTIVDVAIRNRRFPATVVKPPFYKNGTHR